MILYEIALPTQTNDGKPYTAALFAWEHDALRVAGGYTKLPLAQGVWVDMADGPGRVYRDTMQCYRIGVETEETFARLVTAAFERFPDQVAIFTARIGTATVHYKKQGAVNAVSI